MSAYTNGSVIYPILNADGSAVGGNGANISRIWLHTDGTVWDKKRNNSAAVICSAYATGSANPQNPTTNTTIGRMDGGRVYRFTVVGSMASSTPTRFTTTQNIPKRDNTNSPVNISLSTIEANSYITIDAIGVISVTLGGNSGVGPVWASIYIAEE
jgi:hypothetical protein